MKDYKFFILSLVCILLLSWSLMNQIKKFQSSDYELSWPGLEVPDLDWFDEQINQQEKTYKEFVGSDGKLSLKYGSDWIETDAQTLNELMQASEETNPDNAKTIFLAQKVLEDGSFMQMIVSEAYWDIGNGAEEIIQKIKAAAGTEWEITVLKLDTIENGIFFEAVYQKSDDSQLYSKEKILFDGQGKYFLIEFFATEKVWQQLEEEGDEIFNSIQLNS